MKLSFLTHRGAIRSQNQDALQIGEKVWLGDMTAPQEWEWQTFPLLVSVIDGMGGYEGGEKAASILSQTLAQSSKHFGSQLDMQKDRALLESLLEAASLEMQNQVRGNPSLEKMGAVVSGLILRENSVLAFNCGDCRSYRLSAGELEKLTHDHSVVQAMFDRQEITEDAMRTNPVKNIVLSAVTAGTKDLELYTRAASRSDEDRFFICSDGVWETLDTHALEQHLASSVSPVSDQLFEALLTEKCQDNISFVIVKA